MRRIQDNFIKVSFIFTLVFIIFIYSITYLTYVNKEFLNLLYNNQIIAYIVISSVIFIPWLFGHGLNKFNYQVKLKHVLYILIAFIIGNTIDNLVIGKPLLNINIDNILILLVAFLSQLLYPSIMEEVVFRGYLYEAIKRLNLDIYIVIILQAIVFSIIHLNFFNGFNVISLISTFSGGLLLGWLRYKTKSLTPPIILHALVNTF